MSLVHRCDRCDCIGDEFEVSQKEGPGLPIGWHYMNPALPLVGVSSVYGKTTVASSICAACWNAFNCWFYQPGINKQNTSAT